MQRREFLGAVPAALAAVPPIPAPPWIDRPMRWAQLTLVENDPGRFDPAFWLDYFRRIHADAACLSAGGCVAYYPTRIPFHHRSAWMGSGDPFGELVSGCRKLGMVVIARTDPHATWDEGARAHPEWVHVNADGSKRRHWAFPEMWVTCALGPYNFEFMTSVTREIVSLYKVDGIFVNRWAGHGICYCEHCRKLFRDECGMELPRSPGARGPARRCYLAWRRKRLFELWQFWDAEIRKINPEACCIPNTGGGALSDLDMKAIGERAPMLAADRQARRGLTPPWANGKNGKEYRSTMGRRPIIGIFSVGVEEPYRWKDSVQSESEILIWAVEGIANGLRPWFTKFGAVLEDRRWLAPVERLYCWHHRHERYLRNLEPLARIGLVYSQQTAAYYGAEQARQKVEDHSLGMYQALIESRLPFEMVHDGLLDEAHLERYKLLILPNIAALSDAQCGLVRQFAARGGSLLATFETSLYDQWGGRRKDFGLADLLGVHFQGATPAPMRNAYLRLEHSTRHPLLKGLEQAPRIIHGTQRLEVRAGAPFPHPPLTLIPPYPDLPMEQVFARQPKTDVPEVYLRQHGAARIVYFPWDIDRTFWEVLSPDHLHLLRNAILWALDEAPQVTVAGPGILDVTAWRQQDSMTVHLVNLNNPMMMKGPYREPLPCPRQVVRVRLPEGRRARRVQLLVSGRELPVKEEAGVLTAEVESVLDHEVLAIDL